MGVDIGSVGRRYMNELWAKGNLDAVEELVHENVVVRDNMGTHLEGREQLKAAMKEMQASFSDIAFDIEDVIVAGDRVVILSTWRGIHRGGFFGVPGTGRTVTPAAVDVLRIADGKVIEDIGYTDVYTMFQQIGALPAREELAKTGRATAEPATAERQPESRA